MKNSISRRRREIQNRAPQLPESPIANRQSSLADLRRNAGMALVVTLSLIVLVTITAMAFFARATSNRLVEASRANQVLVSQLARTASDYVAGQFLQEIAANSTAKTNNGVVIFQPTAATNSMPQRKLAQASMVTDSVFANLVRQSAPAADSNASTNSTATPSRNGRVVAADSWNAPMLTVNGGFSATNQVPNWIYVNRDGSITGTPSEDSIGRFAYNAYDVGGLLDANVAGYPSSVTGTNLASIKGTLAGADLTALGISQAVVDALVGFRNPGTAASAYAAYVREAAKHGFLSTIATNASGTNLNNFFASRQDLIRYARTRNSALTNALPLLTHFSREADAPSWSPTTNATGTAYQYKADADATNSINRNIPNVRVASAFIRLEGSTSKIGEPIVKTRFPLSRLAWLQDDNLSTGAFEATSQTTNDLSLINAARTKHNQAALTVPQAIQQAFGLVWNASSYRWDYCGPTGTAMQSGILTLDAVAAAAREPNFFELLKAGILSGSLGQGMTGSGLTTSAVQNSPDFQIFRIGASAVDQVKPDSYPTRIAYDVLGLPWIACGVQRLPYISRWTQVPIRNTATTSTNALTAADYKFSVVIVPVLSNPFQGSDLSATNDSQLLPLPAQRPNVRVAIQGTVVTWDGWATAQDAQVISPTSLALSASGRDSMGSFGQDSYITTADATAPASGSGPYSGQAWEQFMNSPTWNSGYVQAANPNTTNTGRGQPVGFRLPPRSPAATNTTPQVIVWYGGNVGNGTPFQLSMEFQAPNGNWYPYSMASGVEGDDSTWSAGLYSYCADLRGGAWGDGANWEGIPDVTVPDPLPGDPGHTKLAPGPWENMVPYSYAGTGAVWVGGTAPNYATSEFDMVANFAQVIVKADPRSIRFNTVGSDNHNLRGLANGGRLTRGLWNMSPVGYRNDVVQYTQVQVPGPRAAAAADGGFALNEQNATWHSTPPTLGPQLPFPPVGTPGTSSFYPSLLCRNTGVNAAAAGANGAVRASYTDPDGIQRIADCGLYPDPAWTASVATAGNPFLPASPTTAPAGNNPDRPIILNRPFRSVAELGYVFRDQPFKTLDFFSDKSADGALLDLFCVGENIGGLRAGVIGLNVRNPAVLTALLSGTATREQATPPTLSSADAGTLAANLVAATATAPLQNKAALSAFLSTQTNTASLGYGKAKLETVARTLADAGQTRTWNLLVDLVAQTGRWSSQGGFVVEGEKSVWNSLAIDRPQAKIIDQQSENVTDY